MKTRKLIVIGLTICFANGIHVGCKKEQTTPSTQTSSEPADQIAKVAAENASIEAAFTDAFRQVDMATKQNGLKTTITCPTVTFTPFDQTTYPKDVIIDYGTSCTGIDGVIRSGQILAYLTKSYIDSGSVTTVTFNNYYVNNRKITGAEIITNAGKNSAGHHVFNVTIQNGNLYSPDGVTSYNSVQQREWIAGDGTLIDPMDDIYMITGSGSGTTTSGVNYTVSITSALRVAVACAWVESGRADITQPNIPLVTMDYGSGTCDNQAVATCNGNTFNIVMP